jgi:ketosteroid isomerase-like protein
MMNYNFMADSVAQSYSGMRFTGVLEKCDDEWKLVQGHLSVPANIQIENR